jgi:hypothetical protein
MNDRTPWTTFDELTFVQHLATIKPASQRKPLLMGYLAGLRRRVKWGSIDDAQKVRAAAKIALKGLE